MRAVVGLLVLAGCGRANFALLDDARTSGASDTSSDVQMADASIDVPPNAITRTFGERPNTNFSGVTSDTFISNEPGEATLNYGTTDELRSEQDVSERILLRFDLGAIPTTATVVQVQLAVEITEPNPAASWLLHPVLETWAEGTLDGGAGTANFTQRQVGMTWTTPGAGTPGSAGPLIVALQPAALGPLVGVLPTSPFQGWVTTPSTNFGMIFFNDDINTARMASSESPTLNARPLLTITYVP